jgi:DNA-directed RNA polymerase subunit RPC12/RpoP
MSSQEQFAASHYCAPSPGTAYPDCPRCRGRMTVKQLSPALSASNVDEVVYGCARCDTELMRDIRRT